MDMQSHRVENQSASERKCSGVGCRNARPDPGVYVERKGCI